jgi:hypothetical protein
MFFIRIPFARFVQFSEGNETTGFLERESKEGEENYNE